MPDAAVIGNLVRDVVAGAPPRPGGAVYHQGRALQALGVRDGIVLVTRCAEADRETLLAPLEALGLPVAWRAARETLSFSFHYEGDRRFMRIDALGDVWTPEDVEGWAGEAIGGARWIVLGALTAGDFTLDAVEALARGRDGLFLDAHGLVRARAVGSLAPSPPPSRELLALVRGLKLNDEEAVALVGSTDPDALRTLGIPEVVLTLGSQGSVVVTPEAVTAVEAVPVRGPVDPTGAGDAFWTAYLVARRRGAAPDAAAREAAAFTSRLLAGG